MRVVLQVRSSISDTLVGIKALIEGVKKGVLSHGGFFVRHGFPCFSTKISTTVNTMVQESQLKNTINQFIEFI